MPQTAPSSASIEPHVRPSRAQLLAMIENALGAADELGLGQVAIDLDQARARVEEMMSGGKVDEVPPVNE